MDSFGEKFGVGQPVRRKEDQRLLKGGGKYTDDVNVPGQAHLAFVRAGVAHARIKGIDASAALEAPGVLAVYSGKDLETDGVGTVMTDAALKNLAGEIMFRTHRLALPTDKVRYAGEPVAVVVAETAYQARDAAEMVLVDYDELPPIVTAAQALAKDAAAIHDEQPDNICLHWENSTSDAYDAAAKTAHKIVSIKLINNRVIPVPMEPKCCLADMDTKSGRMTVYAPFQGGRRVQGALSEMLFGGDGTKVRHVSDNTGGGFGTRSKIYPEIIAIAYAAKKLGRAVKWSGDRSETMVSDLHGRDQVNEAEIALDPNGKILGYKIINYVNIGAWVTENGARLPVDGGGRIVGGVYDIPVLYYSCKAVMTNTVPTDTYRGAGRPEANYLIDRLVEKAAHVMGIDSRELRRRNYITKFPYKTQMGLTIDIGDFPKCQDEACKAIGWDGFGARRKESEKRGKLRGIGLTSFIEGAGGRPEETMRLRFEKDGTLSVICGTFSHGQGHATVYSQILHDKLGIPFDDVNLIQGDTDTAPEGAAGTFGSRSSQMGGMAIIRAADIIIDKGKKIAGHLLQAPPTEVEFTEGQFKARAGSVSVTEIAKAAHDPAKLPEGMPPGLDETYLYKRASRDDMNFPNGCHACEVEVDPDTGGITIVDFAAADDCGVVLNPLIVHGQVHGGVAQGIGQALTEYLVYDEETGQLLTGTFMDYGMPRAEHFPDMKAVFVPTPSTNNELGVKGAGEAGCCGAPTALVHAVLDALRPLGVAEIDMPLTPNRVWHTIQSARVKGAA
ncbi:MAG: molybdopterin-dependent oxidoreductase [Alphaproteobacteria bacterium]|nr:molybdopterin-dependent oxidoreductase [Alphaproteobacteria bacterium]